MTRFTRKALWVMFWTNKERTRGFVIRTKDVPNYKPAPVVEGHMEYAIPIRRRLSDGKDKK